MTVYTYDIPHDERKAISEIQLRVSQAYGRNISGISVFSAHFSPIPFNRSEKDKFISKLFDLSLTSWIDRLEVDQYNDSFSLQFHVSEFGESHHQTNIGAELISYVARLLNRIWFDPQEGGIPLLRRVFPSLIPGSVIIINKQVNLTLPK